MNIVNACCDVSVLVALVLRDEQQGAVRDWLARERPSLVYSDFGWGELVPAVGGRVRGRHPVRVELGTRLVAQAEVILRDLNKANITGDDVSGATTMVARFDLGLRLPDAIHLAIARRHDAPLITTTIVKAMPRSRWISAMSTPTRPI